MRKMKPGTDQERWRGLPVFDVFGHKYHFTSRELSMVAPDRYVFLYDLLAAAILVLADVHGYRETLGGPLALMLWYGMVLLVTALYHVFLFAAARVSRKYARFFLYLPIVGVLSLSIATIIVNFFYSLMTGEPYTLETATRYSVFNVAMGVLFESIFMLFVFPKVLSRISARGEGRERDSAETENADERPRELSIAGMRFPVCDILHISCQDHYLKIVTALSSDLLRGRMSDVLGQLADADGISPHRSHWVARDAIARIGGKSGARTFVLNNDAEIPIARTKLAAVREWLEP